jgi:excisionase family DNA binding protein
MCGTTPAISIGGEANFRMSDPQPRVAQQTIGRSVSIDQAAELLGVSRRTVYNRIRDGRLATIRTLGGSQRVLVDSLSRTNGMTLRLLVTEFGGR